MFGIYRPLIPLPKIPRQKRPAPNANFEDEGIGLEVMRFWCWVMLRPSIGKGIMVTNAEFYATTG